MAVERKRYRRRYNTTADYACLRVQDIDSVTAARLHLTVVPHAGHAAMPGRALSLDVLCPICNDRVTALYEVNATLACRHCLGLALPYKSQVGLRIHERLCRIHRHNCQQTAAYAELLGYIETIPANTDIVRSMAVVAQLMARCEAEARQTGYYDRLCWQDKSIRQRKRHEARDGETGAE